MSRNKTICDWYSKCYILSIEMPYFNNVNTSSLSGISVAKVWHFNDGVRSSWEEGSFCRMQDECSGSNRYDRSVLNTDTVFIFQNLIVKESACQAGSIA